MDKKEIFALIIWIVIIGAFIALVVVLIKWLMGRSLRSATGGTGRQASMQSGGKVKPLCEGEDCCSLANKDNYTCYCSVKCGPREMGSQPGDNPQFIHPTQGGNERTDLPKKCFCQQTAQRNDAEMFIKNCLK